MIKSKVIEAFLNQKRIILSQLGFIVFNCIQYESYGDKNQTLSPEEYLEEINLYFQDIINNKMSGT